MGNSSKRYERGLTLIELLVALGITAILVTLTTPSFQTQENNTRLRAATNQLLHDVFWAQSASIKMNRQLRLRIKIHPAGWCYGITDQATCDCESGPVCTVNGQEKVIRSTDHAGVTLATNIPNAQLLFEPKRGTVNAGTVFMSTQPGHTANVVVTGFGTLRARSCVPVGSSATGLAPPC